MVGAASFSRKPYAQWRVEEVGGARNQDMATAGPTQRAEGRCGWRRQIRVNGSNHAKSYHDCQRRGPFNVVFTWTSRVQGKGARMIGATADSSAGGPEKTAESLRDRFGCFEVVFGPNE